MLLYGHPFAAYVQKVKTAFYEKGVAFGLRSLDDPTGAAMEELAALWPIRKFPVLVDGGRTFIEASVIVEHLDQVHPATPLIPAEPAAALDVRFMDRVFDNHVSGPQQRIIFSVIRPPEHRDQFGEAQAREQLDTIYAWLDERLAGAEWATPHGFSLADCAAAPALLYAHWTHPIPERFAALHAYRARLLARPSYARVLEESRPYHHLFPLGAPDID